MQEQVSQPVTRAYALEIDDEDEDTPGSENLGSPNVVSRSKRTHATMATSGIAYGIVDGTHCGDIASLEHEEHYALQVYVSYVCIVVYFYQLYLMYQYIYIYIFSLQSDVNREEEKKEEEEDTKQAPGTKPKKKYARGMNPNSAAALKQAKAEGKGADQQMLKAKGGPSSGFILLALKNPNMVIPDTVLDGNSKRKAHVFSKELQPLKFQDVIVWHNDDECDLFYIKDMGHLGRVMLNTTNWKKSNQTTHMYRKEIKKNLRLMGAECVRVTSGDGVWELPGFNANADPMDFTCFNKGTYGDGKKGIEKATARSATRKASGWTSVLVESSDDSSDGE